jgi:hypothetical protein
MKITELVSLALLVTASVYVSGCAPVQPWERGTLAKPQMALDPYPAQSMYREHNYISREASTGGGSTKGGGCGCN